MKLLVAIAHYGVKNRQYLDRMLEAFRAMSYDVSVVVLSEVPKNLPPDVELRVGLPSENPWSLPFAHRQLFVDRLEDYDLFLYSEDDTLIEQRNVDAFVELSQVLPAGYLPGFMRYELDGEHRSMCTVHSYYRWDPSSVFTAGEFSFARFTNDHGACYLLTRDQLRSAIASGGYALEPHEGRYDMLVTAATDPYTRCGFTKVFCLERIDDLLVHHLPNIYLGKLGISGPEFDRQVDTVRAIAMGDVDGKQLFEPEVASDQVTWSKHLFPRPSSAITDIVPSAACRILSVGAVDGRTEQLLVERGHKVSAVPVDPVVGVSAQGRGVEVLSPSLRQLEQLEPGGTDRILAIDTLQFLEEPVDVLRRLGPLLAPGGRIIATLPDHRRYALRNLVPGTSPTPLPRSLAEDGSHRTDASIARRWFQSAGFDVVIRHRRATRRDPLGTDGLAATVAGNTLLIIAKVAST